VAPVDRDWQQPSCRAAVAVAMALLAACGAGGPASGDDAAAVRADVTGALTTANTAICELRRYATKRFVDQDTFSIPEIARIGERTCRADVDAYAAESVTLSRVRVSGGRATARMQADGGAYGYGVLDVALVKERVWKLDRIMAVDVDRRRFDELQTRFASARHGATPTAVACAKRRLARIRDAEIERAVVAADVSLVSDPLLVCFVRPQLRRPLSPAVTGCVVGRLRRRGDELLRVLLGPGRRAGDALFGAVARACAARRADRRREVSVPVGGVG
jgi:hypothetical protein